MAAGPLAVGRLFPHGRVNQVVEPRSTRSWMSLIARKTVDPGSYFCREPMGTTPTGGSAFSFRSWFPRRPFVGRTGGGLHSTLGEGVGV